MATDGKAWEGHFERICTGKGISIVRFYDVTNGYKKVDNPSDFVISRSEGEPSILVECKAVNSKKSFSLKFDQLDRLLKLPAFKSAIVIWFVQTGRIIAISAKEADRLRSLGVKSINPDKMENVAYVDLNPVYKRINPCDLEVNNLWKLN